MQKFLQLTAGQKGRIISFAIIVMYLFYGVLAYVWEVRMKTPDIAYVDSMPVDGSEMAPLANLMIMGTNGFLDLLGMVLSVVAISILALILLVPWRLIAIRKHSVIAELEKKVAKYMLIGFVVLSLVISLILLRFTNLLFVFILTAIPAFFIWLLGVWPLHRNKNRNLAQIQ